MIMSKHNQQLQITFSLCSYGSYNSVTTVKQNLKLEIQYEVKSPTKAHTYHHNGDLKIVIFSFSDSA